MLTNIKNHLSDHSGDAYIEKMILIAIAFVIGGMLFALLTGAFGGETFRNGMGNMVENMFSW